MNHQFPQLIFLASAFIFYRRRCFCVCQFCLLDGENYRHKKIAPLNANDAVGWMKKRFFQLLAPSYLVGYVPFYGSIFGALRGWKIEVDGHFC
jgi:hypothetical protein